MADLMRILSAALGFLWRWSLVVTVPVGVLFSSWTVRTVTQYRHLGIEFESLGDAVDLQRVGGLEADKIIRDIELALRPRGGAPQRGLRAIELFVPESSEAALLSEPPHSGRRYVEASLVYPDGDIHEVKVKFRGDHFWHFANRKKSMRIKAKKKHLFERMRAVNLNAPKMPDQVSGHISLVLARQLGLIAPKSEMVELFVNGENRGVHLLFEQMEEMTLRTSGKMPGDLYSGDVVSRDEYRGLGNQLFENAGLWEKIAINNHFDPHEYAAMERLVDLLAEPASAARSAALRELVDVEEFGRYAAFRLLCQTFHYDETHNWRLYYDPWRTRFLPAVWDPVGWHIGWAPRPGRPSTLEMLTARIDLALIEDGAFLAARQRALDEYFDAGKDEELLEAVDATIASSQAAIDRDPGLFMTLERMTVNEVREAQAKFRETVVQVLSEVEDAYRTPVHLRYAPMPAAQGSVVVRMDGRRTLTGLQLDLLKPPVGRLDAGISWLTPEGPRLADVSGAISVQGTRVTIEVPLSAQVVPFRDEEKPARLRNQSLLGPAVFGVTLGGPGLEGNDIVTLSGRHSKDEVVPARRVEKIAPLPIVNAQSFVEPHPRRTPMIWSGERVVRGIETYDDDLIIEPGTVLRMAPGSSVFLRGRVVARGTASDPIRVEPLEPGQDPWGTLAIVGHGADGSELSWVEMREGSGHKVPLSEYSAMFSVHDVDGIRITDCRFQDSKVVDDMVHAVYSTVHFKRCTFVRSLFDAVDLDISEGIVEECHFIEAGNDGLDLMTSTILVRSTKIEDSGDKGISVGEDTQVFVADSRISGCEIGMQIKDRSHATVVNSELVENRFGIDAYKKNWRYDSGGFGFIYKTFIKGNEASLSADKYSRIRTHDCSVERPVGEGPLDALEGGSRADRSVELDSLTDVGVRREARAGRIERFAEEVERVVPLFRSEWSGADPRRRGRTVRQ